MYSFPSVTAHKEVFIWHLQVEKLMLCKLVLLRTLVIVSISGAYETSQLLSSFVLSYIA